jgi:hypothetical protein
MRSIFPEAEPYYSFDNDRIQSVLWMSAGILFDEKETVQCTHRSI